MLPRPSLLLRSIARPPSPWTGQSCTRRTIAAITRPPRIAPFHSTARRPSDDTANHYETLQVSHDATPADIKRQFYALSKRNHPDHNRDDPTASTRFVAISEAYHTLSVPEKRRQYDAQLHQSERRGASWGSSNGYPQGSYSSAAYGARPASGLNKKRSTFRGPPPSFYNSGGYGRHGAKRTENAYSGAKAEAQEEAPQESYGDWGGGYGPGQHKHGHEVPHFDNRRHKETHDQVNEHIHGRRKKTVRTVRVEDDYDRGGMLLNFIMVSGVIGLIGMTAKVMTDRNEARVNKQREG
jgi:hypothetical protein